MVAIGLCYQPGARRPGRGAEGTEYRTQPEILTAIAPADGLVNYLNVQWLHLRLPNE